MARSLWTGSLSFGLVNVPVRLFSAVRDQGVHFNHLHEKDGVPIETRRFCSEEEREVPYDEIVSGYEVEDGKWVTLTDEELAAAEPRKTKTIDIEEFVDLAEIDPIYFDHPYFLVPEESEGAARAYRLLVESMGASDRVALGRFVLRTKEYLVAIRVRDDVLALTTMLFSDEVRDTDGVERPGGRKPAKKQIDQAVALIEAMSADFDPSDYEDCHRQRLQEIIERKRAGKRIKAPAKVDEPSAVPDLMAALEESLAKARAGRDSGGDGGSNGDGDLRDASKDELLERAREQDVPGRSKMTKDELVDALAAKS
jgi:DNA end-binding protein Ku